MFSVLKKLLILTVLVGLSIETYANAPKVGRSAAAKYFQKNPDQVTSPERYVANEPIAAGDRYLSVGASVFTKTESYSWGNINKETDVGKWGLDMSYRLSQYNSLLDYSLRVSYNEYEATGKKANKLVFMYAASLPDAGSRFPLYFGAAAGVGAFLTQLPDESPLSFDYQLYLGLRLFDLYGGTGFYVEGGLKNHLQLTSDGQLNGTYVSGGAVFSF